jgi:hypothetical protein
MSNLLPIKPDAISGDLSRNVAIDASYASVWINTYEFARLVEFTERGARKVLIKCLLGGTWRGTSLTVRVIEGAGGRSGKSYQLYVPSLPEDLRVIWHQQHKEALNPPKVEPIMLPAPDTIHARIAAETAEWKWKLSVIAPALQFGKRSRGRGAMLNKIANKTHVRTDGKTVTLSLSTLRGWIKTLEDEQDETALVRKRRAKGLRRYAVNRIWDKAAPFPDMQKSRIADEIETYTRSLWAQGAPGWHKVNELASSKLLEISRAAGWPEADNPTCNMGRHYAERFRGAKIVATKEKDAKRFADHFEPRIKRNRDDAMPMDIVIGDVHPVDILIKTEDGREITPRMIAWVDWATGDVHSTIVFLGKGQGIRQEHIARAFVAMVRDWGLPRCLYLDNGSEYKWEEMMEGFSALVGLASAFDVILASAREIDATTGDDVPEDAPEIPHAVIRAKPYNAPAKYAEAIFGNLEQYFFSMIPGYIGGDRTNKRTHLVGKAPKTFNGNEDELDAAIQEMIVFYRNTSQTRGHLEGKSPNQKRAECYAKAPKDWHLYTAPYEVFLFAFSTIERPKVMTNGIQVNGEWYYDDCLIPHIGSRLEIRAAKWDKTHLIWLDANGKQHLIPQVVTYRADERAGAIEQSRRKGKLLEHVKNEKAGTVKLDMVKEITRHNAMQDPPPALPEGIAIGMTSQVKALADARKDAPKPKETRLLPGSFRHRKTGDIIEIQAPPKPEKSKPSLDLDKLLLQSAKIKDTP